MIDELYDYVVSAGVLAKVSNLLSTFKTG